VGNIRGRFDLPVDNLAFGDLKPRVVKYDLPTARMSSSESVRILSLDRKTLSG